MKPKYSLGSIDLTSSVNPEQLASTVSGAIIALSAAIIWAAGLIGFPLAETEVATAASQIGASVGGIWFLYGLIRKVVVKFTKN